MKQKIIYLLFLSIGVLINLVSCGETRKDYIFSYDIIYKNNTNHHIKYYQYIPNQSVKEILLFDILPNSEHREASTQEGEYTEILSPEYYKRTFASFQGDSDIMIRYDDIKCLIYNKGEGSTTDNYLNTFQAKKINDRHYEFTYTFTEEEAQKATACP